MRVTIPAICATILFAAPALAQNAGAGGPANPPVAGVVQSFDGKTLSIKTADGAVIPASLAPDAQITLSVKKTVADIKPGDFIASGGTRGPDGKIHANEIRIFSAPGGEGQFSIDQPGQEIINSNEREEM